MLKKSKEIKLTRFQYCSALKTYQEQSDFRDISATYYNLGTVFDENLYANARRSLLNFLAESTDVLRKKYLVSRDTEEKSSFFKENCRKNVVRICARRKELMSKIHQGKRIERADYRFTYFGLPEFFVSCLKNK